MIHAFNRLFPQLHMNWKMYMLEQDSHRPGLLLCLNLRKAAKDDVVLADDTTYAGGSACHCILYMNLELHITFYIQ